MEQLPLILLSMVYLHYSYIRKYPHFSEMYMGTFRQEMSQYLHLLSNTLAKRKK